MDEVRLGSQVDPAGKPFLRNTAEQRALAADLRARLDGVADERLPGRVHLRAEPDLVHARPPGVSRPQPARQVRVH